MKVFDKIRDLFTEEVEEEVKEEPIKKEVIQVEIPAPEVVKKEEEVKEVEDDIIKPVIKPQEEKVSYPVFFDEKDFEDIEKREKKEIKEEPKKEVNKEVYKDPYNYKKEEKKHFSPTPIISPVYGVLDKNYKKDDIIDKPKRNITRDSNMTIDDVRNKAYGTLEDELESTLFGKTSILFATNEEKKDLENELDDVVETLDLLREDHIPKPKKVNKSEEDEQDINEEVKVENDVLDDLLSEDDNEEAELNDNIVEDALGRDFNSDEKLSESDLFNLIDDMYAKGDK